MKLFLLFCAILSFHLCASSSDGEEKHWALLVAGSSGYYNYRHQADICHAYHVVRSHGIPDERIIVMMYDDIAHSRENPFPGNIINQPNGKNVYPGVLKDYTRGEVTPEVFLKVLTGDEEGVKNILGRQGKVIKSGPNDHVFVNFADHGAPGLIAFPDGELYSHELIKAIKAMHKNKQYKKMVLYIEACESGSMFAGHLPQNINVFATTASSPDQSSYACYYDKKRRTYLGDVYSVNWMQDSDAENLQNETLQEQYKIVKAKTNTSIVEEYGDLSIRNDKVGDFQGQKNKYPGLSFRSEKTYNPNVDAVPSEDVKLETIKRRIESSFGMEKVKARFELESLLENKKATIGFFKQIIQFTSNIQYESLLKQKVQFSDFRCYKKSIELIKDACPGLNLVQNDYALRQLRSLANLCETDIRMEIVWDAIKRLALRNPICKAE